MINQQNHTSVCMISPTEYTRMVKDKQTAAFKVLVSIGKSM